MNDQPVICLLDTGATLTIISTKGWEALARTSLTLTTFEQIISTAPGSPIEVKGNTEVQIKVAESSCYLDVIVADIDNEVILSLDFLQNRNCKIDVLQQTLEIKDQPISIDCLGFVGCSRIVASKMVQIPPMSEKIITGTMVESTLENGKLCIIEPSENFIQKGNAFVAKTLTYSRNIVPVRLMNVSEEVCNIYPGTNIAKASSVAEVQK